MKWTKVLITLPIQEVGSGQEYPTSVIAWRAVDANGDAFLSWIDPTEAPNE